MQIRGFDGVMDVEVRAVLHSTMAARDGMKLQGAGPLRYIGPWEPVGTRPARRSGPPTQTDELAVLIVTGAE